MSEPRHFRASPRPAVSFQIELVREGPSPPLACRTSDIGTGGVFVATSSRLQIGERLLVVLTTPSAWEPLSIDAEVAWERQDDGSGAAPGFGLKFLALTEEQKLALAKFVSSLEYQG